MFCSFIPASDHALCCSGVNYLVTWWAWREINLSKTPIFLLWSASLITLCISSTFATEAEGDVHAALSKCLLWITVFETVAWSWFMNSANSVCILSVAELGCSALRGLLVICSLNAFTATCWMREEVNFKNIGLLGAGPVCNVFTYQSKETG